MIFTPQLPRPLNSGEIAAALRYNTGLASLNSISPETDNGRSFRPLEGRFGNKATRFAQDDVTVDNEFVYDSGDEFYYVVFNHATAPVNTLSKVPDYKRIGINKLYIYKLYIYKLYMYRGEN